MVRQVLEVIVREQGIQEPNLFRAISTLSKRGSIPPFLFEAASLLRTLGNAGAHSKDERLNAIHTGMIKWLLTILLEYLYFVPIFCTCQV
jgi:Domain of unknown function (DUF4145)